MQASNTDSVSDSQMMAQIDELKAWLATGGSLGDAFDVSPEQREALYQFGHGFYTQARYAEAFKVFSLLVVYEHMNERYLMGLAGAAQMLGRYTDALQHYATATMLMLNNPLPVYYSAECFIALGQKELAAESLRLVIELSTNSEPYAALEPRAQALLASLSDKRTSAARPAKR